MCVCVYIYIYIYIKSLSLSFSLSMYIYIYIHTHMYVLYVLGLRMENGRTENGRTANLRPKILDFKGFDSSIILILRGGLFVSVGNFPEIRSQTILAGIILVGRLGVHLCMFSRKQNVHKIEANNEITTNKSNTTTKDVTKTTQQQRNSNQTIIHAML